MNWYVLKTKPKKEETVLQQLQKASFELFLPKLKVAPLFFKPLFPSYLFIRTNFDDPLVHRMVRFTRGVSRILGDINGPLPLADVIAETLKERTRDGSILEQDLLFREGDSVIVKRGLLKDLIGIIEKNVSDQGRVKVLFKWLNSSVRAVIKYRDLEKAA